MSDFKLTDEQEYGLECFATRETIALDALAGTGKTTELVAMAKQARSRRGLYLAYNRAIKEDASAKLPSSCKAMTAHGLAFGPVGSQFKHRLDAPKVNSSMAARLLGIDHVISASEEPGAPKMRPSAIARLASETVQRFCWSADEEVMAKHVPWTPGFEAVRNEIVPYIVGLARRIWADAQDPDGQLRYEMDYYLKMFVLSRPRLRYDYILVDECFPPGTMITTDSGDIAIESIIADPDRDWQVLASLDGGKTLTWSHVTSAYRTRRRGPLVRLTHEHGAITCTANHPVWVVAEGGDGSAQGAWTPAGLVRPGDSVSCVLEADSTKGGNLFADVLARADRSAQEATRRGRSTTQDLRGDEEGALEHAEPHGVTGSAREDGGDAQGCGSSPAGARRQREWADATRADALQRADLERASLAPRACRPVWKREQVEGAADALQDRPRLAVVDDRGGDRRGVARLAGAPGSGSTQGRIPAWSRVGRVEVLESGGAGEPGGDRDDDHVYTLSTGAGSYVADGVLVKNCQDLNPVLVDLVRQQIARGVQVVVVGDRNQTLYEWRGAVNAMSMFAVSRRATLSKSFRFGPAIAEEANKWLEMLDSDLFVTGYEAKDSTVADDPARAPDAVLCRTNAEVVRIALELDDGGQRFALAGDVGGKRQASNKIKRWAEAAEALQDARSTDHPDLYMFSDWRQVQEHVNEEGGEIGVMVRLIDKYGVEKLKRVARRAVDEVDADVVLSTGHSAKGREWSTVEIAGDFEPENAAERKLAYVAVTRGKERLHRGSLNVADSMLRDHRRELERIRRKIDFKVFQ